MLQWTGRKRTEHYKLCTQIIYGFTRIKFHWMTMVGFTSYKTLIKTSLSAFFLSLKDKWTFHSWFRINKPYIRFIKYSTLYDLIFTGVLPFFSIFWTKLVPFFPSRFSYVIFFICVLLISLHSHNPIRINNLIDIFSIKLFSIPECRV